MPRVIFLITDLDLGGSPLVVRQVVCGLLEHGPWQPTVVSLANPGIVGQSIRAAGVEVLGLGATGSRDVGVLGRWRTALNRLRPSAVVSVLIHANAVAAVGAIDGPPCRYFQSIHTLQVQPRWHWPLQYVLARRCAAVIAPSPLILKRLEEYGVLPRGVVIPNGIDTRRFAAASAIGSSALPWPDDALVVGYVGRFDPVKRLPVLLAAVGALVRTDPRRWGRLHLVLVGYGPQEAELRQQAKELDILSHVHFTGATAQPERWYKTMDVLCMPSLSEGFGLNMVEAMAAGRAVLACRGAAVEEIITHGRTGWLADAPNVGGLKSALEWLLTHGDLRRDLGKQAAEVAAQRFGAERMIRQYQEILEEN